MQVTLWERNLNIAIGKCFINRTVKFVIYPASVNGPINPAEQLEIKAGLTEGPEANTRCRVCTNCDIFCRDFLKRRNNVVNVRSVGDTH